MKTLRFTAILLLTGCTTSGANRVASNDGAYSVIWSTTPAAIPVDEYFSVTAQVTPTPARVVIDAVMPGHRHGMLNEAFMEHTSADTWTAQDMLFHMHGHWELRFDITDGEGTVHRAQTDVHLE